MSEMNSVLQVLDAAEDERFMRAAISLARRGLGQTSPNPAVGALVVRDGVILGRGWTQKGGRPHAEPLALAEAGAAAKGATLYVTLEPCSHHGKTPPCAETIVAAGIARVVSAVEDPDSRVAGRGHALLAAHGIAVTHGVLAHDARRANLGHMLRVTQNRPMVTLKLAETADGYVAGTAHDPRLSITGAAANAQVNVARAMHDAIMVGIGTVLADDPLMTVRLLGLEESQPLRVVLDTHLAFPLNSRLAETARDVPVLVITGPESSATKAHDIRQTGVEVVHVGLDSSGHVDLQQCLALLAERGLTRVFSEGGPRVAERLIALGLADDIVLYTSVKPLGRAGVSALSPAARASLADPLHYFLAETGMVGADRRRCYERVL